MTVSLAQLLESQATLVADGGMGTMLFAAGLARGSAPEVWNVERPEAVRRIHADYIAAGAQIILTNSFGGSRARLSMHGLADRAAELNRAAAQIARSAAQDARHSVVIAGSIGPTGQMLAPYGDLEPDDAAEMFAEQAAALVEGGVDVLWIETMADMSEVRAAVEGCRRAAPGVPLVATLTYDTRGRTMMGETPEHAAETLEGMGLLAHGANCGNGPDELLTAIDHMHHAQPQAHLVAKANAGLPHMVDDRAVYDAGPEVMAAYARQARANGARIIGACCGSTPEHVRAIAEALRQEDPVT
ncbi:MAG: betaine--homocysteine S-methyltransferase [Anaerolineae bacterium]|nr:betaine--homocysteine S-methyltransferase [Anaerolineae bacterium]NUQ03075.1 betaine--homocysteine S-methyltransferase [Anaerolineae bacterium]